MIERLYTKAGSTDLALAYHWAQAGETDKAFALLEKAYQERDDSLLSLKKDSLFDPLKADPRYKDLLKRVGLPEN